MLWRNKDVLIPAM